MMISLGEDDRRRRLFESRSLSLELCLLRVDGVRSLSVLYRPDLEDMVD